jgi:hypothetical protein
MQVWPDILRDMETGCLQPGYLATYEKDYSDDPPPRRSILPRASFLTTTSLIVTRGCHNRCGFCYPATHGLRMPYRMRRPVAHDWRGVRHRSLLRDRLSRVGFSGLTGATSKVSMNFWEGPETKVVDDQSFSNCLAITSR